VQAAEKAIANPLLDEISLHGAKGVLINITGGYDLTLFELDEAANIIREKVDPDANIIVGSTLDTTMEGVLRVSVVATGIDIKNARVEPPHARRSMQEPLKPAPVVQAPAAPVAAQPEPAPAPAPARAAFEQPRSFAPEVDDVPAPVYRPAADARAAEPRPAQPAPPVGNDAGSFIAPRPRPMGAAGAEPASRAPAGLGKPAVQAPAARPAAPAAKAPRFGIGALISRMSGGSAAEAAQPQRAQPPVTSYDDEAEPASDADRLEIPAFLRRQAN
jgi:cell division protein FtsZ